MVFVNYFPNFAFLPCCSCFLQLLCWVTLILHTLCLLSGSLTTMSLVYSPLVSPRLSCLLFYLHLFRMGYIMFPVDTITQHVTICQQKVSKREHKINLNLHEKYNILESRKRGTINEYTLLQII